MKYVVCYNIGADMLLYVMNILLEDFDTSQGSMGISTSLLYFVCYLYQRKAKGHECKYHAETSRPTHNGLNNGKPRFDRS